MAMAIDSRQQPQLSGLGYDHMRYQAPQFTNPWVSAPGPASSQLYTSSLTATSPVDASGHQQAARPSPVSVAPYSGLQVSAAPMGAAGIALSEGILQASSLLDTAQDLHTSRSFGAGYPASASTSPAAYAPTSAPQYPVDYTQSRSPYGFQDPSRRPSQPPHPSVEPPLAVVPEPPLEPQLSQQGSLVDFSRLTTQAQRDSFSEAVDASRNMLSLSQSDITPRNIYGNQGSSRSSMESYGFPSAHSAHSSISSASTYPSYYNGSVSESVTDYSSASESVGDMGSRTLPRPSALVGTSLPPAPQSMMGQFSSKVSSSSQKKHKCKICDKRFTRPSSLQTHMYSHTGEKRKFLSTSLPWNKSR